MILIVGGAASGKKTYAQSLGYDAQDFACGRFDARPVLCDLQELLRQDSLDEDSLIEKLLAYEIVICTEVGSGIVPISADERAWRDRVGRMCARLAQEATTVIRMVCGIPTTLKGEAPCNS